MKLEEPIVSVIMAAYNRSNVLHYAVSSLLRSTYVEWELLVVGDACTDDTAEVVAGFGDSRIQFWNLPVHFGEQSAANNEGLRKARGKYIAYLNQDDLWFPDHLEKLVATMEQTKADGAFAWGFICHPQKRNELQGVFPEGIYDPRYGRGVAASQMLFRRELLEGLGGWRSFRESYLLPSQDLLFRAWKSKRRIVMSPHWTVLILPSAEREKSYALRVCGEHQRYFEFLCKDSDFRERELLNLCCQYEADEARRMLDMKGISRRWMGVMCRNILLWLGVMPLGIYNYLVYRRKKGGAIDVFRQKRGLPPI